MNSPHNEQASAGKSYQHILSYFFPEMVTAFVIYSALNLFDARLIADLKETPLFITLGVTRHLTNFITKIAEGFSIGTVVLCGMYNGRGDHKSVGSAAVTSVWAMGAVGLFFAGFLFVGARVIYTWYGIPDEMIELGTSFLRLRAVGIFFMFIYFSFIGFLRAIKNTRVPMVLFVVGAVFFVFFDIALVRGQFGFPQLALQGSAYAFLIQHVVMCIGALMYILWSPAMRRYSFTFLQFKGAEMMQISSLSWPVMIDKASIAWIKMWLVPMIAPLGAVALASYNAINEIIQLAFVPAIAFGQIITFLVSNDVGAGNWGGVKEDIKKVMILTVSVVSLILIAFSVYGASMIGFFDSVGSFTEFAAKALPVLSTLAVLDLLQLVLSASLRGAGDVKTVMMVRLICCTVIFIPLSWIFSLWQTDQTVLKFILVCGTFYLNAGIMSLLYIRRLSGENWHHRIQRKKGA